MRKLLLILALTLSSLTAMAVGGTLGSLSWNLNETTGVLTISGEGPMVSSGTWPWEEYSRLIQSIVIEEGVTRIGSLAFSSCSKVTSLSIPHSLTHIASMAFWTCTSIKEIHIPPNVQDIEERAFTGCKSLIGIFADEDSPFFSSIDGVLFDKEQKTLIHYPAKKYDQDYVVPSGVRSIRSSAFCNSSNLFTLSLPEGLLSLGDDVFHGCYHLTSLTIPSSVTHIGDNLFYQTYDLLSIRVKEDNSYYSSRDGVLFNKEQTSLIKYPLCKQDVSYVVPETVNHIEDFAFAGALFTSITFPKSLVSVGYGAFSQVAIQSVSIPENLIEIHPTAFTHQENVLIEYLVDEDNPNYSSLDGVLFNKDQTVLYHYPRKREGDYYAIPSGVTSISNSAFANSPLTSIELPLGLTVIEGSAFYRSNLTSITIPESVEYISASAFSHSSSLSAIYINRKQPPLIDYNTFENISDDACFYAPDTESLQLYLSADGWNQLSNIKALPGNIVEGDLAPLSWRLDRTSGVFTLSGSGRMLDSSASSCPWREYSEFIRSVIIEEGVIRLGNYAFQSCRNLTSVSLPQSLTEIGNSAFAFCPMDTIQIPAGVSKIGNGAFEYCHLTAIIVDKDNSSYSSENGVLFNKEKTELIIYPAGKEDQHYTIPPDVQLIHDSAFANGQMTSIILPEGLITIGEVAFRICYNLTSINIPASVTQIGDRAFEPTRRLQEFQVETANLFYSSRDGVLFNKDQTVLIKYPEGKLDSSYIVPETVQHIEGSAFENTLFTTVIFPESLVSIESHAFFAAKVFSLSIPKNLTDIHPNAFISCNNLTEYSVDEENSVYSAQEGVLFSKEGDVLYHYPINKAGEHYAIPSGVTTIGSYAFSQSNLLSVTIPLGVTAIENHAFNKNSFTTIIIPETVNHIGERAFYNSPYLSSVYVNKKQPIDLKLTSHIFQIIPDEACLYVPFGSGDLYRNADGWDVFPIIREVTYGYYVSIDASASQGGSIYPNGRQTILYDADQSFHFTPDEGYYINEVLIDGVNSAEAVEAGSYTFQNTQADHTLAVHFKRMQYTLSASAGEGGTITPEGNTTRLYGEEQTYLFTPDAGYYTVTVKVDGQINPEAAEQGFYSFKSIKTNSSIHVEFAKNVHTITADASEGGVVIPNGVISVPLRNDQVFAFVPGEGYYLSEVWIDGKLSPQAIESRAYTFKNVTENHSVFALFKIIESDPEPEPEPEPEPNEPEPEPLSAQLQSLSVTNGRMVPEFTPRTKAYTVYLDCGASASELDYTPESKSAEVTLQGKLSFPTPGSHSVSLQVQDGTEKESYVLTFIRPFDQVVVPMWDNVLSVINNPNNNGGYQFTKYQWYSDREMTQALTGETSGNLYLPNDKNSNPNYTVWLTTSTGISACGCRVGSETPARSARVYPNPVQEVLTVEQSEGAGTPINIYDLSGKLVKRYQADSALSTVDISEIMPGTYIVRVGEESFLITRTN